MRPRVNKRCACCGTYGHCITINGCDYAANFINTNRYLASYPQMEQNTVDTHKQFQQKRETLSKQKGAFSQKFMNTATKKGFDVGPKVAQIFDILGETFESNGVCVLPEENCLELDSDDGGDEEFHDTNQDQDDA